MDGKDGWSSRAFLGHPPATPCVEHPGGPPPMELAAVYQSVAVPSGGGSGSLSSTSSASASAPPHIHNTSTALRILFLFCSLVCTERVWSADGDGLSIGVSTVDG